MSLDVWLTFVLTAALILVIPGPTIIYVVGQSLNHGQKASLPLSFGVVLGDATCITLSLLGLGTLLSLCSATFLFIKYLGAAYLIYLGIKLIRSNSQAAFYQAKAAPYKPNTLFRDVFFVTALNPKGIIFHTAFMPQFINPNENVFLQLIIFAITFLLLALTNAFCYTLLASKMSALINSVKFIKTFNLTGGIGLICAGLYSATINKK